MLSKILNNVSICKRNSNEENPSHEIRLGLIAPKKLG